MRKASLFVLSLVTLALSSRAEARAPDTFEEAYAEPVIIESPQWFAFEFKIGPFRPDYAAYREAFPDDRGWLLATELDITTYHIPYVGQLNAGLGWGWSHYEGKATVVPGSDKSGEDTSMTLYPMSLLAVLRVDTLARMTVVPLTFAAKLGADFVRWKAKTGSATDGDGVKIGLRWAVQAALELDFLDRRSARRLDDDFEINHTFLMFEYFGSETKTVGGDSFLFGLGMQF